MREKLLFLVLSFCLLSPSFTFASSPREEIINEALKRTELALTAEELPEDESLPEQTDAQGNPISQGSFVYSEPEIAAAAQTLASQSRNKEQDEERYAEDILVEEAPKVIQDTFLVSAAYDAKHLHYKEYEGQDTLDEDYGKLKGYYLALKYKGGRRIEALMGKPYLEGYFWRYDASVTYDGASSLGPLTFDEKAEVQRYGIKLGAYTNFAQQGEFLGYLDVGHRVWYRGENGIIQGVTTYAEKYWWTYFGVGAGFEYPFFPRLSAGLDAEWMVAPKSWSRMKADLWEGATFHLGTVSGAEIKLPLKYSLTPKLSFDLTPYFTYWHINKSSPATIAGTAFYEPDSRTHIEGLLTGLTYSF